METIGTYFEQAYFKKFILNKIITSHLLELIVKIISKLHFYDPGHDRSMNLNEKMFYFCLIQIKPKISGHNFIHCRQYIGIVLTLLTRSNANLRLNEFLSYWHAFLFLLFESIPIHSRYLLKML